MTTRPFNLLRIAKDLNRTPAEIEQLAAMWAVDYDTLTDVWKWAWDNVKTPNPTDHDIFMLMVNRLDEINPIMTVSMLIEKLKEYDPDTMVCFTWVGDSPNEIETIPYRKNHAFETYDNILHLE